MSIEEDEVITKLENLQEDRIRNQRFSTEIGGIVGPKAATIGLSILTFD